VALAGNDRALKGETGMVEIATFLFLVVGIGFCVSSLTITRRLELSAYLKGWLLLLVMGAAYFALFILLYCVSLHSRLRLKAAVASPAAAQDG
jgi:uncharacterized membrane-anchored protein